MVDEQEFEQFAQRENQAMVLGRSFGRGFAGERASSRENISPGRNGQNGVETRPLANDALRNEQNGEGAVQDRSLPVTSTSQRQGAGTAPLTPNVSRASTEQSANREQPRGRSSLTEHPVIPPLVNALRTILSTESHEAVAQLVAGLLVT